jgi:hypothetical protein
LLLAVFLYCPSDLVVSNCVHNQSV